MHIGCVKGRPGCVKGAFRVHIVCVFRVLLACVQGAFKVRRAISH